jgi:hypothetical protein
VRRGYVVQVVDLSAELIDVARRVSNEVQASISVWYSCLAALHDGSYDAGA